MRIRGSGSVPKCIESAALLISSQEPPYKKGNGGKEDRNPPGRGRGWHCTRGTRTRHPPPPSSRSPASAAPFAAHHGNSVADPGCLSRIPDPNFFYPGSRIQGKKNSGSASKNLSILTQKIVSKLSEICSGCLSQIWIPDPDFFLTRIPGSKSHRIPDPEHCMGTLHQSRYFWTGYGAKIDFLELIRNQVCHIKMLIFKAGTRLSIPCQNVLISRGVHLHQNVTATILRNLKFLHME